MHGNDQTIETNRNSLPSVRARPVSLGLVLVLAFLAPFLAAFISPIVVLAQGKNFVELQIIGEPDILLNSGQKWLQKLTEVGADSLRMTNGNGRPSVKKTESASRTSFRIVGVITARGKLLLPGGSFTTRDIARIKDYIDEIQKDGAEVAVSEKMAFGLTARQLVDLHSAMATPYENTTAGRKPQDIVTDIRRSCSTAIKIDPSASAALQTDNYQMQDELKGLSHGTVLAAVLRPVGLVAAPRRERGKQTEILITDSRQVDEHWPVGWPLQGRPSQKIPKLFEQIPVNIHVTLEATLNAIQQQPQMKDIPFLYDYNSMAQTGLELGNVRVNLEAEKMSYFLILSRSVAQSRPRLRMDMRVDEAGKPFLWFYSK